MNVVLIHTETLDVHGTMKDLMTRNVVISAYLILRFSFICFNSNVSFSLLIQVDFFIQLTLFFVSL